MEIIKSVFHSKSKRYQFIRYCTVGSLAAGIHYGVYFVLQEYELVNLNIAYTIGYATSFICNFFLTSYFTFRSNPQESFGIWRKPSCELLDTYGIVQPVPVSGCKSGNSSIIRIGCCCTC